MSKYPRFASAVRALGRTRLERAQALGVHPKVTDRLMQRPPLSLVPLLNQPELLRLLADDAEELIRARADTMI